MKKGLRYYYLPDEKNWKVVDPLGKSPDYYDLLSSCLTGDIGMSEAICSEVLQMIKDVAEKKVNEEEFSGNAGTTRIKREGVEINLVLNKTDTTIYPFHIFKKAVEEWYDFIKTERERIIEFDYPESEEKKLTIVI